MARAGSARSIAIGAVIAALTLAPASGEVGVSPWCVSCGDRGLADLLLNILLFAPLGASVAASGGTARRALLTGLAFSLGIELLQLVIPGRAPTARDVIANGFGAWLAAVSFHTIVHWLADTRRRRRRAALYLLLLAIGLAGLRWLDAPAHLRSFHWTQWQPLLGDAPRWPGLLHGVSLGGTPLPEGRLTPEHPLRDLLDADSTLRLDLLAAGRTPEWMPIFGLVDSWRVHQVLLGQDGDDLLLRLGRRSSYLLLETPEIRIPGALRDIPHDSAFTITLRGIAAGRPCLGVIVADSAASYCAPGTTPGRVWALFLSSAPRTPDAGGHPLDALTMALLLLPFGVLLAGLPRRQQLAAAGIAIALLVAWTRTLGFAWPSGADALAMPIGLAVGAVFGRRLAASGNVADDARADDAGEGHGQPLPDAHG